MWPPHHHSRESSHAGTHKSRARGHATPRGPRGEKTRRRCAKLSTVPLSRHRTRRGPMDPARARDLAPEGTGANPAQKTPCFFSVQISVGVGKKPDLTLRPPKCVDPPTRHSPGGAWMKHGSVRSVHSVSVYPRGVHDNSGTSKAGALEANREAGASRTPRHRRKHRRLCRHTMRSTCISPECPSPCLPAAVVGQTSRRRRQLLRQHLRPHTPSSPHSRVR